MKPDEELILQTLQGDQSAFAQLVERYEKPVYNLALRMVQQEQDALDLSQEAFVRAWRGLAGFRSDARFSTWLYRLVSNVCIDFLRAQKNHKTVSLTVDDPQVESQQWQIPDPSPLPEELALEQEHRHEITQAMAALTQQQRQILTLRAIHGLSYTEIADVMALKEGTVKSRLARAREQLRQILQPEGNQNPAFASKPTGRGDA